MQGAVRRMSPLFPPLHFPLIFFPPSVRPWGNASVHQVFKPTLVVGRTCSFCGVQCVHSCADPFLMLEEGALVSFPICPQKHSLKFRSFSRLHPPPPSLFPPFSSSALALTPTCQQPGQQHRVTPGRPVRVHRKISTQARSGILPSNATLHHPTALHCNAVDPLE